MKKKASQQKLRSRWKRKLFATLMFAFCLGSFFYFQARYSRIAASLKPRIDQKPQIAFLFIARNRLPLEFVWDAFFLVYTKTIVWNQISFVIICFVFLQGEDGKFSIYVHSRPGFVLSEATTQSKYFLNRQVNDSIQVRCYQNGSKSF